MQNIQARPFLKWAGGKGQLLGKIKESFPDALYEGQIKTYVEPFVGGGAVFFEINKMFKFETIVLNDSNVDLIMTYTIIRDHLEELICVLAELENSFLTQEKDAREKIYYDIRQQFNNEKQLLCLSEVNEAMIKHSAHLIFLNKTCFNGLYRLNSRGAYNVPFGDCKNPNICDVVNLRNVSEALQGVTLVHNDFELLTEYVDEHTFVYMDPPYRPLSGTASFNNYQKAPFNDDSQRRLANWFTMLGMEKKALLMLSNSDPKNTSPEDDFFDLLYKDFDIMRVSAARAINSKGSKRGNISELLITNYAQQCEEVAVEKIV